MLTLLFSFSPLDDSRLKGNDGDLFFRPLNDLDDRTVRLAPSDLIVVDGGNASVLPAAAAASVSAVTRR